MQELKIYCQINNTGTNYCMRLVIQIKGDLVMLRYMKPKMGGCDTLQILIITVAVRCQNIKMLLTMIE